MNQAHYDKLREGAEAWNKWREDHPDVKPDLQKADLNMADLQKVNLERADLEEANLRYTNFRGANLRRATLGRSDLAMVRASNLFSLWSLLPVWTTLSISFGDNFITLCFWAIRLISTASISRLSGDRSFESLTPSWTSLGASPSLIRTPAITSGPITEPRPASSTPATSIETPLFEN